MAGPSVIYPLLFSPDPVIRVGHPEGRPPRGTAPAVSREGGTKTGASPNWTPLLGGDVTGGSLQRALASSLGPAHGKQPCPAADITRTLERRPAPSRCYHPDSDMGVVAIAVSLLLVFQCCH